MLAQVPVRSRSVSVQMLSRSSLFSTVSMISSRRCSSLKTLAPSALRFQSSSSRVNGGHEHTLGPFLVSLFGRTYAHPRLNRVALTVAQLTCSRCACHSATTTHQHASYVWWVRGIHSPHAYLRTAETPARVHSDASSLKTDARGGNCNSLPQFAINLRRLTSSSRRSRREFSMPSSI